MSNKWLSVEYIIGDSVRQCSIDAITYRNLIQSFSQSKQFHFKTILCMYAYALMKKIDPTESELNSIDTRIQALHFFRSPNDCHFYFYACLIMLLSYRIISEFSVQNTLYCALLWTIIELVIWHKFLVTRSEAVLKSRDLERDYWQSHTKWLFSCLISPIYFCCFEKFDSHYNWTFSPSKMKPIIPFSNLISNIYFRPSSDNFVVVGIIKTKNFKSSACMC